jgi:hypothetical protein
MDLTPEGIFSYFHWRATEEDNDADFLEECAKFSEEGEKFLDTAKAHRARAENIRASLDFPSLVVAAN